jgi:hypothetical protein
MSFGGKYQSGKSERRNMKEKGTNKMEGIRVNMCRNGKNKGKGAGGVNVKNHGKRK